MTYCPVDSGKSVCNMSKCPEIQYGTLFDSILYKKL